VDDRPLATLPLRRNRDFMLLQAGQLLSTAGTQSASIAYTLLVLAITGSPAQAGLVAFARLLPFAILTLPAGLAADRWNRKRLMIAADMLRAVAMGALGVLIIAGTAYAWAVFVVAFVEGGGATLFSAAQAGAMRGVVPARQLPAAAGAQEARRAVVGLGAPILGGALYGLHRALPFLVDAGSYAFSTLSLLAMRAPFQERRSPDRSSLREQVAEGFRFLWNHRFLRTTSVLYATGNFLILAILLVVVVAGRRQGLSSFQIGLLSAAVGAGTLVGSMASPLLRRALSVRAIVLIELWTWLGAWLFVVWPNVYVLAAVLVPFGIAAPVTDSVIVGYRIAMTPDRLIGRVESVRSNFSLLGSLLGPLAAGLLLESLSTRATVAALAVVGLALAVMGTLSPAIRRAPSLDELA
jgi:MFS family permease